MTRALKTARSPSAAAVGVLDAFPWKHDTQQLVTPVSVPITSLYGQKVG